MLDFKFQYITLRIHFVRISVLISDPRYHRHRANDTADTWRQRALRWAPVLSANPRSRASERIYVPLLQETRKWTCGSLSPEFQRPNVDLSGLHDHS